MPNELIRQQNVKRVLQNAMQLFMNNGVESTSVEMIARRANLSLRTVQNYYHTKNDLIAAVLDYEYAIELEEMETCVSTEEFQNMPGAKQILTIVASVYHKAVKHAEEIFCETQMQYLVSHASKFEGKPLLTGNWKYITEHIQTAFNKGLQDGSITRQMELSLLDAKSITLALYGIKEQISFAMCDRELKKLFQPEIAAQKYVQQIELLLSVKQEYY